MDKEDYLLYASDLESYEIGNLETAFQNLAMKPRAEGETAFPDIGTILEAVRAVIRSSRPSPEEESTAKWMKYLEDAKAEGIVGPDGDMLARIAALNEKHSLDRPKVIDTTPVLMACPHCSKELPVAPNIRFWTPMELRDYADSVESVQKIAAANRAATLEAQKEPLTETV